MYMGLFFPLHIYMHVDHVCAWYLKISEGGYWIHWNLSCG